MSTEPAAIRLLAPAKVNLYLEILGQRPNGYHDLRSVVVPVSIMDELEIEPDASGVSLTVGHAGLPERLELNSEHDAENLILRAARVLQAASGCGKGARMRLVKQIPVGGGMGGGSADAAAALVGLNRLWDLKLPRERLAELGASLGCDVPALLGGGTVCMEGLGERVTRLEGTSAAGWWVVLANPGFAVSTRDIYSRCPAPLTSSEKTIDCLVSAMQGGDLDAAGRNLFNGLEPIVFAKYPLIEMLAEALEKAGAIRAILCGSGASVFGLARNERHAKSVADQVRKTAGVALWCRVARLLPDGVMAAHGPLEARV